MRDGGRIAAAIEILDTLQTRHQPVKDAVRDWGKAAPFCRLRRPRLDRRARARRAASQALGLPWHAG